MPNSDLKMFPTSMVVYFILSPFLFMIFCFFFFFLLCLFSFSHVRGFWGGNVCFLCVSLRAAPCALNAPVSKNCVKKADGEKKVAAAREPDRRQEERPSRLRVLSPPGAPKLFIGILGSLETSFRRNLCFELDGQEIRSPLSSMFFCAPLLLWEQLLSVEEEEEEEDGKKENEKTP